MDFEILDEEVLKARGQFNRAIQNKDADSYKYGQNYDAVLNAYRDRSERNSLFSPGPTLYMDEIKPTPEEEARGREEWHRRDNRTLEEKKRIRKELSLHEDHSF